VDSKSQKKKVCAGEGRGKATIGRDCGNKAIRLEHLQPCGAHASSAAFFAADPFGYLRILFKYFLSSARRALRVAKICRPWNSGNLKICEILCQIWEAWPASWRWRHQRVGVDGTGLARRQRVPLPRFEGVDGACLAGLQRVLACVHAADDHNDLWLRQEGVYCVEACDTAWKIRIRPSTFANVCEWNSPFCSGCTHLRCWNIVPDS